MPVEPGTYINNLNPATPTGAAPKSEGDDELRSIKAKLKATFPAVAGAVTASHTELNLLKDKTNVATLQDIADAQLTAALPGVNDPANAGKFLKAGGTWASVDLLGEPAKDKGNSGTAAQVVNYADGEGQTITATGAHSLTAAGFPAGRTAGILLRMIGYGNFPLTTTGIIWIKADGSQTTNFATSGIALSAGESFVSVFTLGDGKVYAKVAR